MKALQEGRLRSGRGLQACKAPTVGERRDGDGLLGAAGAAGAAGLRDKIGWLQLVVSG
jgi:hypothetical protein